MINARYKVGDKVRIKSFDQIRKEFAKGHWVDLWIDSHGIAMNNSMLQMCGTEQKISKVERRDWCGIYVYRLKYDRKQWTWTEDMFSEMISEDPFSENENDFLDLISSVFEKE